MGTLRSSCWRLLTISSVMRWQPLDRVLSIKGQRMAVGAKGGVMRSARGALGGKAVEPAELGRSVVPEGDSLLRPAVG